MKARIPLQLPIALIASLLFTTTGHAAMETISQVYTSYQGHFACVLSNLGHVKCWGSNSDQQVNPGAGFDPGPDKVPLDLGQTQHGPVTKLALGSNFGCALRKDQSVTCWGGLKIATVPLKPAPKDPIDDLVAGQEHACALYRSGTVRCWGSNQYEQLGTGDTKDRYSFQETGWIQSVQLGRGVRAIQVAAGRVNTCVLTQEHQVKCWGRFDPLLGDPPKDKDDYVGNPKDELGDALPTLRFKLTNDQRIEKIAMGDEHACILIRSPRDPRGLVKCWGDNDAGQLGRGDLFAPSPEAVQKGLDQLKVVDLGIRPGDAVQDLSLGYRQSCVLLRSGSVKCWGRNESAGLGIGSTVNRGTVASDMGEHLAETKIAPKLGVKSLSATSSFACALVNAIHAVKCWGENGIGELGLGDRMDRGKLPEEMGDSLPFVDVGF